MRSTAPSRPPFGLTVLFFLACVALGALIQVTELTEAYERATRRGLDLWIAFGLVGQVLRVVGPVVGIMLVLGRSPRARVFWMELLVAWSVLAGFHLLAGQPPSMGAGGWLSSARTPVAFDLDAAESLRLLVASLAWLVFWGTAPGARRPFASAPPATSGPVAWGGSAVARRRSASPWLALGLLSGGAVAILLLQAGFSVDPDLLQRVLSRWERQKATEVAPPRAPIHPEPVARIPIPGAVDQILSGGRGHFLALRLRQNSQLLVFGAAARDVVATIDLLQPNAPVALGGERLIVFEREPAVAHVRLLSDLTSVETVPLGDGSLHLAALGSHDDRRLFLAWSGEGARLEVRDARAPRRVLVADVETELAEPGYRAGYMVPSPHGERLALGRSSCDAQEVCSESFVFADDGSVKRSRALAYSRTSGSMAPRSSFEPRGPRPHTIPSSHPRYHLVHPPPRSEALTVVDGSRTGDRMALRVEVPELAGIEYNAAPRHLWLLPQAGLLVVLTRERDRLVLYRLDEIVPQ